MTRAPRALVFMPCEARVARVSYCGVTSSLAMCGPTDAPTELVATSSSLGNRSSSFLRTKSPGFALQGLERPALVSV
eukprot:1342475-Prymnesium_polylepis.1